MEEVGSPNEFGPTTRHACCQNRVANIHRIADIVRGAVIPPGGTFCEDESSLADEPLVRVAVQVDEVAPSLRWATAKVTKAQRGERIGQDGIRRDVQQTDPWGQSPAQQQGGEWGGTNNGYEPAPF